MRSLSLDPGETSTSVVATSTDRVKSPASRVSRFTPHFRLIPFVHLLGISDGAARLLVVALWNARKRGEGKGTRAHEALFWRKLGGLGLEAGRASMRDEEGRLVLTAGGMKSVQRDLAELRDRTKGAELAPILRWRVVHPLQLLPDGARARVSTCVFYIDVDRIVRECGLGRSPERSTEAPIVVKQEPKTEPARNSLGMDILSITGMDNSPDAIPGFLGVFGAPTTRIACVNYNLTPQQQPQPGTPTRPPPIVMVENDPDVQTVMAAWRQRLWIDRVGLAPRRRVELDATKEVRAALDDGRSAGELLEAIDEATRSEWMHAHPVAFGDGIFRGPLDRLLAERRTRMKRERAINRAVPPKVDTSARSAFVPPAGYDEALERGDFTTASEILSRGGR